MQSILINNPRFSVIEKVSVLPKRVFNLGRKRLTRMTARINAIVTMTNNSEYICLLINGLLAPITFLSPISLALLPDWAVVRFTKFIHAIRSIKIAIAEKIRTNLKVPLLFNPNKRRFL